MPKPNMKLDGKNLRKGDTLRAAQVQGAVRGAVRNVNVPGKRVMHDGSNISIVDVGGQGGGRGGLNITRVARWEAYEGT
jgi:hypothetical protein